MKKTAAPAKRIRRAKPARIKKTPSVASRYVASPHARHLSQDEWLAEEERITQLMRGGNVDTSKTCVQVIREMRR
jgi:hypothetical protein